MIRELTERVMPVRDGEQRFSKEMSTAFFNLGVKPPVVVEEIKDVRAEPIYDTGRFSEQDRFNIVVDLARTVRPLKSEFEEPVSELVYVPTFEVRGEARASTLASHMNDPANLSRANRALYRCGEIRDWGIVIGFGGGALAASIISRL